VGEFTPGVYCADVGSTRAGAFAWARGRPGEPVSPGGASIEDLVSHVANDLEAGTPVALGFECPLFVPLAQDPLLLTAARDGDGNRPWSASAGATVLATGLTQVVWVLREIRRRVSGDVPAFLRWDCFQASGHGLLLWEAFVSGGAKTGSHLGDATRALET